MVKQEMKIRSILDEKTVRGENLILVQWESSWIPEDTAPANETLYLDKLAIRGVTRASYEQFKNDVTQWEFIMENTNEKKVVTNADAEDLENTNTGSNPNADLDDDTEIWTYEKLRKKAPELLLDLYEDKCQEFFSR
ncbi:hypothetical protein PMAYCL1PPCAC_21302 [Pristionchus mayeri]|uniref:Chromo domain-containing protein n=1 Tax=Pristionchus mayeri TaxID=1317129 RepID=A0AAN5CV00_9BILA|nr:hypothetical protein PMAYCL1PPCAC_21302 [Pristionchus mayeri]